MRDKKLIQLYITNMCNSRCKTCSIWKNEKRQELDGSVEKVFLAFPDADYVIGGGEAILHKNIEVILFLLQTRKANYTLLSNCIWYDRLCELVGRYEVPAVTVSFDGLGHDEIRGFLGNMANIIKFKEWCDFNDTRMKISYTYSKYNEGRFEEDMKFIKDELGFNEIYLCIAQDDIDLLMTDKNDERFEADSFEQILKCDMISDKDKNHIRSMITGIRRFCTSQNNVHTIYSNGDIVRCQSFKSKEVLGNINNMSVEEIRETLNSVKNEKCPYDEKCNLLCQRRYD
ncbi:MAG: hypothetical protein K2N34_01530 [Lachnospiraceae bacterium]|nr:hypothetical protein [Lachnospiraceae bacterium]